MTLLWYWDLFLRYPLLTAPCQECREIHHLPPIQDTLMITLISDMVFNHIPCYLCANNKVALRSVQGYRLSAPV